MPQESETKEWIILFVILAAVAVKYSILDNLNQAISSFNSNFLSFLQSLNTWRGYFIIGLIALPFILYLTYLITLKIDKSRKKSKERLEALKNHRKKIKEALEEDIDYFDSEKTADFIDKLKDMQNIITRHEELREFNEQLIEKFKEARLRKITAKHDEKIHEAEERKRMLEQNIERLKIEEQKRIEEAEQAEKKIIKKLDLENNPVFKKDELTEKEFKVLLNNGYKQTNQYCIYEKKLITVLVKTPLNHTMTHTFLVQSTIRLLKTIPGITNIEAHLTKDADITFKYVRKTFAIEIETGTLLERPKQLRAKVAYLNKKYENRWMFIVSNKDLIWRYRKLGFSTQRNEVEENLERLLKNGRTTTPSFSGWSSAVIEDKD